MLKKRIFMAIMILALLVAALYIYNIRENLSKADSTNDSLKASTTRMRHQQYLSQNQLTTKRHANSGPHNNSEEFSSTVQSIEHWQKARISPQDALEKIPALIVLAKAGDLDSHIAIFSSADWCVLNKAKWRQAQLAAIQGIEISAGQFSNYVASQEKCKSMPHQTEEKRFEFLAVAAQRGDVEAMLTYESALAALPSEDSGWLWRNVDQIQPMRDLAIHFLTSAARLGVREANISLADIYATGRYGVTDNALSEMYRQRSRKNEYVKNKGEEF